MTRYTPIVTYYAKDKGYPTAQMEISNHGEYVKYNDIKHILEHYENSKQSKKRTKELKERYTQDFKNEHTTLDFNEWLEYNKD